MKNVINGCIAIKMSGLIGALNNDSSRETEPCKINFDQVFFGFLLRTAWQRLSSWKLRRGSHYGP